MTPAKCPACAQPQFVGARSCPRCGQVFGATPYVPQQLPAVRALRWLTWIVVLICAAGFLFAWSTTGDGDMTVKAIVVLFIGIVWSGIVLAIAGLVAGALRLGWFLGRGPRQ